MPIVTRGNTDLYEVLGVDASVSGDDIARAFRARAKQLHPDTSADPDAAHKFNELVRAYGVLSNHRTRREYDQTRASVPDPAVAGMRAPAATNGAAAPAAGAVTKGWSRRRAWTAVIAGALVAVLGIGAGVLTWQLHQEDAQRHARFRPITAVRVGQAIAFVLPDGRDIVTKEPEQHGEGNGTGPTVKVRYDPADPKHVIVDANTVGRDITLGVVALKLLVGGVVFVVLGTRRLRRIDATRTAGSPATTAR